MKIHKPEAEQLARMADEASELLLAMANPNRLMILCYLLEGESTVGSLADRVGMNPTAASQQLAKLRAMKLVRTRRHAQQIFYSLASQDVERVLQTLYGIYCEPVMK